jgi:O-antigen/teichoic acid export membrane protein
LSERQQDLAALAKGGRTNILGFLLRLLARLPFLFIAGRLYGPDLVGRFALAVLVVEFAALLATLGLKRGLAQALTTSDKPHVCVVWDALAVALVAALIAAGVLVAFPEAMFPNSAVAGMERLLPLAVIGLALTEVALAALAYRLNVRAAVTARAVVEPWTISIGAWAFSYVSLESGLILAYAASVAAAQIAALIPFLKSYGVPVGWRPEITPLWTLARRNVPLAGADAVEWATRNVDRFILGLLFAPAVVGVYYMAQQVASLPSKLKSSFDPVLGPVITQNLRDGDRAAVAAQVRQVGFWIMAAQGGLALMGSIPGEAVMGVVGPQFVAGTAALAFLLLAEVVASTGAVCESALVYVARMRNLMISLGVLAFQIAISFALIGAMRALDFERTFLARLGEREAVEAATVAVALMLALAVQSIVKTALLERLLGAPVTGWRTPLIWAAAAGGAVGYLFTTLPPAYEWAELVIGVPAIAAVYCLVLWKLAFGPEDRALFKRMEKEEGAADVSAGSAASP